MRPHHSAPPTTPGAAARFGKAPAPLTLPLLLTVRCTCERSSSSQGIGDTTPKPSGFEAKSRISSSLPISPRWGILHDYQSFLFTANFHGRSCSLIFRSRVGSLVSKKIPSPRFSPGSCPTAPASPPVLFVGEYQKAPGSPLVLFPTPGSPPLLLGAPVSPPVPPPVLPRFSPHSTPPRKLVLFTGQRLSFIDGPVSLCCAKLLGFCKKKQQ